MMEEEQQKLMEREEKLIYFDQSADIPQNSAVLDLSMCIKLRSS